MMLNTIIGMMGTIAVIGLFGCLWKFLGIKLQKMKKQIELTKYKKTCRIILYVSISCFVLFLFVIGLWFGLIYPSLK
ncbi:hypothetical protein GL982_06680 [Spiroplasma citri]|uniref:Spiroplasmavirus-related protein n=1 Tax=Spiroplasma kunkelii CR2-3x TaxID=273035 RepID=A0A0K2JJB8_SPIKU|nr:hypothetical protein [Spiroplasma citri]ALA98532.1 hypothetical protein SKUN_001675 [Spiroplasma kunkelii CR2-3x]QIA73312.1 hypothetical protein GL982_06680 [Spiroplasma citri]